MQVMGLNQQQSDVWSILYLLSTACNASDGIESTAGVRRLVNPRGRPSPRQHLLLGEGAVRRGPRQGL